MNDEPSQDPDAPPPKNFWRTVGTGFAVAGKAVGRAAIEVGAAAARGYTAIDPDLRRFAAQAPLLGLTHLGPAQAKLGAMPDDGHRPVLFVHGLGGHRGNFAPMSWFFKIMGRSRTVSVGFEDKTSIGAMAAELVGHTRELLDAHPQPPDTPGIDLVCHSMGGIVARVALEDPWFCAQVAQVITLGTPHHGTEIARWARTDKIKDLRPGSPLMERLARQVPWDDGALPPLTCFWSPSDLVIMPPASARIDGAQAMLAENATHLGFLIEPRVMQAVFETLSLPKAA